MMRKLTLFLLLAFLLTGVTAYAEEKPMKEAVLTFYSFDGGGPEYKIEIDDPEIVTWSKHSSYDYPQDPQPPGSGYTNTYTFKGLKPGKTTLTVSARSPIAENYDAMYIVTVDDELNITLSITQAITRFELVRISEDGLRRYDVIMLNNEYQLSVNDGAFEPIQTEAVDALYRICEENDLYLWDGFDGDEPEVLDGEIFSLDMLMTDGAEIHAKGSNAFPENYFAVADRMEEILKDAEPEKMVDGTFNCA